MDEKSKAILAGFTGKPKRSQLTPHRDLICKLHQRGCAFRAIVNILSENFSLTVAPSTVCRFIARLEKGEQGIAWVTQVLGRKYQKNEDIF